jgi:RNA polymerase sigma-70 factor (ECF subfamily)
MGKELEQILQEGLNALPEIHRTIVVLRDVEHLSYDEIADVVELPVGTVKSRLFRARAALRAFVEERYEISSGAS